jgi:hypothetical protein
MSVALVKRQIFAAISRGLLQGSLNYKGLAIPCAHSPINTQQVFSSAGGGLTEQTLVTLIVAKTYEPTNGFEMHHPAVLTANDGLVYSLRLSTIEATGSGYFVQLTARAVTAGA